MTTANNNLKLVFLKNIYCKNVSFSKICILLVFFLSIFYGVNSLYDSIISICWLLLFLVNFFKNDRYLILGTLTIFQTQFTIFGFSAFKLIIIVFVLVELLNFRKSTLHLKIPQLIFCGIMVSFGFFIFFMQGLGLTFLIPYICSCAAIIFLINAFGRDIDCFKLFSYGFIVGFLICSLSGVFLILIGRGNISNIVIRFKGTMPDPNHYSMHGMLALLLSFFLIKDKKIRIITCLTLLLFCILSASTNFFFCFIISAFGVYISKNKNKPGGSEKILFRTTYVLFFTFAFLILIYLTNLLGFFVYKYPDSHSGIMKIVRQFYALQTGDFETFSSYRTDIWGAYMDYFYHQNILKMFFGGNFSSTYGVQNFIDSLIANRASHNTFIDILMCTGLVGFSIFLISCFGSLFTVKKNKPFDNYQSLLVLMKITVLIYFFGLSCFPSWFLMMVLFI